MNKVIKILLCIPAALLIVIVPLLIITLDEIGAFMSDFGDNPTPRSADSFVAVYPDLLNGLLMVWLIYYIYKESYLAIHLNLMFIFFLGLFLANFNYFSKNSSLLMFIFIALFILVYTGLTITAVNSDKNTPKI
jgi:hypothetical protein